MQFQIVDDLLDTEGSAEKVGKAIGKDAAAGKMTYPGILGAQRSRTIVEELAQSAAESLEELGESTQGSVEPLRCLGEMLMSRNQ